MKNEAIENIITAMKGKYSENELNAIQDFLDLLQDQNLDIPVTWKKFAEMMEEALCKQLR